MAERLPLRWTIPLVVTLTGAALVLPFVLVSPEHPLRDRHGQPALRTPIDQVAVVPEGKLFHDPRCPFIHGRPLIESAAAASADGFIPCPRCLGRGSGNGGIPRAGEPSLPSLPTAFQQAPPWW